MLLEHGMNEAVVRGLTYDLLGKETSNFKTFLNNLSALGVTHVVAERFQSRGGPATGVSPEAINWMLCLAHEHFGATNTRLVIPSQWKTAFARAGVDLKEMYLRVKPIGITPHQTDASLIGVWALCKMRGIDLPEEQAIYDMLDGALRNIHEPKVRAAATGRRKRSKK